MIMPSIRIALMSIKLVMRTKAALFFTFLFPLIFLFVYSGIFARGNPEAVVYMFGPVVTLNIMGSGFWGLGLQSVMQRERGSLRRYRLAPIGPGSMVFSSLLANYLLELPTIAMLVFCAMVFFHMPLKINLLTLLVLVTVGTFAFAGFGLTIASVANTMQEAQVYNNVVWFTLLFLSGVTVPLPMLPQWIQRFAAFLPATYLVTSFQAIMVRRPVAVRPPGGNAGSSHLRNLRPAFCLETFPLGKGGEDIHPRQVGLPDFYRAFSGHGDLDEQTRKPRRDMEGDILAHEPPTSGSRATCVPRRQHFAE